MPATAHRSTLLIAAAAVAATIFAVDSVAGFDVSIAILYSTVVALVAWHGSRAGILAATVLCAMLASTSWFIVHSGGPDVPSLLRLLFAVVAISLTAALLISRKKLQAVRTELEESRVELLNFTDSVPPILWRTRPDGTVDFFNRRYTEVTGHDREEAIAQQTWRDRYHPDDLGPLMQLYDEARAAGEPLSFLFRMRQADDSYRWMFLQGRPVLSADGTTVRWYGGTTDVHNEILARERVRELMETLEQRVEERTAELLRTEARYSRLFDVSHMTFAETDFSAVEPILAEVRAQGIEDLRAYMADRPDVLDRCLERIRTTRVNAALAQLLGYDDSAELVARYPLGVAEDGRELQLCQLDMAYHGIDHIDGHAVLVAKDGARIRVYYTVNRLGDGLHLCSHLDLTEQERVEEMRRAAQEELSRANRIATVGALSASIAHELNQPIASMLLDAQSGKRWLNREIPDIATTNESFDRLIRTAKRMGAIVSRTRENIVAGRRTATTAIDLCGLAFETRDLIGRDLARGGVQFEIRCGEGLPPVSGDAVELQQVLVNLLTNAADAVRETTGQRRIALTISEDEARDGEDRVRITVSDTGPGIADSHLEKLFEPFFTTKVTGIGMGLQICRSAVEGMGGQLVARNRTGGGAEFTFTLPASSPSEEASAAPAS